MSNHTTIIMKTFCLKMSTVDSYINHRVHILSPYREFIYKITNSAFHFFNKHILWIFAEMIKSWNDACFIMFTTRIINYYVGYYGSCHKSKISLNWHLLRVLLIPLSTYIDLKTTLIFILWVEWIVKIILKSTKNTVLNIELCYLCRKLITFWRQQYLLKYTKTLAVNKRKVLGVDWVATFRV